MCDICSIPNGCLAAPNAVPWVVQHKSTPNALSSFGSVYPVCVRVCVFVCVCVCVRVRVSVNTGIGSLFFARKVVLFTFANVFLYAYILVWVCVSRSGCVYLRYCVYIISHNTAPPSLSTSAHLHKQM